MINPLKSLFGHCAWANRRTLQSLLDCPRAREEGTPLLAHVLAVEEIWLARLQGRELAFDNWPSHSLEECRELIGERDRGWNVFLSGLTVEDLPKKIEYRTGRGDLTRDTVADILTQAVTHGAYHRGQIAKIVSRAGGTAATTDYILYIRLEVSTDT